MGAKLEDRHAGDTHSGLLRLTPWHQTERWSAIAVGGRVQPVA